MAEKLQRRKRIHYKTIIYNQTDCRKFRGKVKLIETNSRREKMVWDLDMQLQKRDLEPKTKIKLYSGSRGHG